MHDDLSILWGAIKELHPAYGIYTPADSLQKVYDSTVASINTPLTETAFMSHVYPLLSQLRCGHTQLRHSAGYKGAREPKIPFGVLVRDHRAWITIHHTYDLNTGDELLSINNVPVAEMIDHGADLYAGDGYNQTFKELFLSEYDGFEDAINRYYHWREPFAVKVKRGEKTIEMKLSMHSGVTQVIPASTYPGWVPAKDSIPLAFQQNAPTAWLQVKSYQYIDTLMFKDAFKQIHERGIKDLIVDLRHNTGGDIRIAAKLLSYLADSSFHIVGDVRSRIPNPAVNHFEQYFDTARTEGFKEGFTPGKKEGDYYHVNFKPVFGTLLEALPVDATNHYDGNLFVLIDGATFSSAAHTAAAIKAQCKKAVFIGRETAGAEEGCSGGTIQLMTLPATHIVVEFPWMRFVSVAKHPVSGRGIIPDYTVIYEAADVMSGKDLDLPKALSLIH